MENGFKGRTSFGNTTEMRNPRVKDVGRPKIMYDGDLYTFQDATTTAWRYHHIKKIIKKLRSLTTDMRYRTRNQLKNEAIGGFRVRKYDKRNWNINRDKKKLVKSLMVTCYS